MRIKIESAIEKWIYHLYGNQIKLNELYGYCESSSEIVNRYLPILKVVMNDAEHPRSDRGHLTRKFENGWHMEMTIAFTKLKFQGNRDL